jgi:hypothetical protein
MVDKARPEVYAASGHGKFSCQNMCLLRSRVAVAMWLRQPHSRSSSTLRTVLGAGVRCRPWFRVTGALRGRISTSKLVSARLSRAPLIAAVDAGASVLQPKGDPKAHVTKKTFIPETVNHSLLVIPLLPLDHAPFSGCFLLLFMRSILLL